MKEPEIKIIGFDLGDVLMQDTLRSLEQRYGFGNKSRASQKRYVRAIYDSEIGKLPTRRSLKVIREVLGIEMSLLELENRLLHPKLIKPNWRLMRQLSKHYKIIIPTNNQRGWPGKVARNLNIDLSGFPIINSANIGLRKPHTSYYRYILKKFKIRANQFVFIDDKIINIRSAQSLGIHVFHYQRNDAALRSFLKNLGIRGM